MDCAGCGACCVAPDIAVLDKPLGLACPHLDPDCRCTTYQTRPQVCRDYPVDAFCEAVAAPSLEERVARYLGAFGLEEEARQVKARGIVSLKQWRRERFDPPPPQAGSSSR